MAGETIEAVWARATALHRSGDLNAALPLYGAVIAAAPNYASAYGARAALWLAAGRPAEALVDLDKLVVLLPEHAGAHLGRGQALAALGRFEEALQAYDRLVALAPQTPDLAVHRAEALLALGRAAEAKEQAKAALVRQPSSADAHLALGAALAELGDPQAALAEYDAALARNPDLAAAHSNRGNALRALERPEEALAAYDAAIFRQPQLAHAHFNRAVLLHGVRRFSEALSAVETAIAIEPRNPDFHIHHGVLLGMHHRFDEALAASDRALALRPDHAEIECNKYAVQLIRQDFARGWPQMEWRKRSRERLGVRDLREPEWTGAEDLKGRRIFVHWEQGLGDTLQFCRYLPLLAQRGARVSFSCQDGLAWVMRSLDGEIEVIRQDRAPPVFNYHAALMSLPLAFGTRRETIPADVPYLVADPERIAAWRERLGEGGFKIGVAWRGSALGAQHGKSFGPDLFAEIGALSGVRLISLQKGAGTELLATLPPGLQIETLGQDFDAGPDAFRDTAAVMESLDLVITTDTSVAHLAGALGRPTWTLLPFLPDWRWFLGTEVAPWYPTMRLFRQAQWDDWSAPFATMRQRLGGLLGV